MSRRGRVAKKRGEEVVVVVGRAAAGKVEIVT